MISIPLEVTRFSTNKPGPIGPRVLLLTDFSSQLLARVFNRSTGPREIQLSRQAWRRQFNSETPYKRPAEIPRGQINLGYDDIELADPGKDEGWHSYSDLSEGESSGVSNQDFSDY